MDNVKLFSEIQELIKNIGTQKFLIKHYANSKNARHLWYTPQDDITKITPLLAIVKAHLGSLRVISGHLVNALYGLNVKTLQGLSNPNNSHQIIQRATSYNEFRESDIINYVLFTIWYKLKRCVVGLPIFSHKGKLYNFPSRRDLWIHDLFMGTNWIDNLKSIGVGDNILKKLISLEKENKARAKRGLIC